MIYDVTSIEIDMKLYKDSPQSFLGNLFGTNKIPIKVMPIEAFLKQSNVVAHLNDKANQGWELMSIQPIYAGAGIYSKELIPYGFPLISGFLFFWKK